MGITPQYFLAMSCHHLGQRGKARACDAQAVAWMRAQPDSDSPEGRTLQAFRAEAAAVLGLKDRG